MLEDADCIIIRTSDQVLPCWDELLGQGGGGMILINQRGTGLRKTAHVIRVDVMIVIAFHNVHCFDRIIRQIIRTLRQKKPAYPCMSSNVEEYDGPTCSSRRDDVRLDRVLSNSMNDINGTWHIISG